MPQPVGNSPFLRKVDQRNELLAIGWNPNSYGVELPRMPIAHSDEAACGDVHAPSPRVDDASGSGATVAPTAYGLQPFGGVGYTGSWGSGNYVLGVGRTNDRITDPRRRSEYTDSFSAVPR